MVLLTNPNFTYVLVVVGVSLIFLSNISSDSKTKFMNIGMGLSFVAAVLAFLYLRINPWAFFVVVLSPFAFARSVSSERPQSLLLLLSIFMLALAPYFLFLDTEGEPAVSNRWAWVSVLSATILWLSTERMKNMAMTKSGNFRDSIVGLLGEALTDIEHRTAGSVLIDGEIWQARSISKETISAGSTVRVLRQDGFWLTVKKTEKPR